MIASANLGTHGREVTAIGTSADDRLDVPAAELFIRSTFEPVGIPPFSPLLTSRFTPESIAMLNRQDW